MSLGWALALFLFCLFLLALIRMKPGGRHPTGYVEDDPPVSRNDRMGYGGWERREAIDHPEDLKDVHKTKDRTGLLLKSGRFRSRVIKTGKAWAALQKLISTTCQTGRIAVAIYTRIGACVPLYACTGFRQYAASSVWRK